MAEDAKDDDGLPLTEIGVWAPEEKHARLRRYIGITRDTRKKYLGARKGGATYIDLYSASGRGIVRETSERVDGSPLVAFKAAREGGAPFSEIHVGDINPQYVAACTSRLIALGAPVHAYVGPAADVVDETCRKLNAYGLHFAFLDPFNLETLPFTVIQRLAGLKRMDILIHVSVQDLQRNLDRYVQQKGSPLDIFAPGWREVVDCAQTPETVRRQILTHWLALIRKLDMKASQGELVTGSRHQRLYYLVLVSRSRLAHELWEKIRNVGPQRRFPL